MLKKDYLLCQVVFRDLKGSVREMFSTEHLIRCFNLECPEKYLEIVENPKIKEVFNDQETISVCMRFFENNLNVTQTSKACFMHRNTFIYRLEKIEKLTGLNLRRLDDAVLFKNLITVREALMHREFEVKHF